MPNSNTSDNQTHTTRSNKYNTRSSKDTKLNNVSNQHENSLKKNYTKHVSSDEDEDDEYITDSEEDSEEDSDEYDSDDYTSVSEDDDEEDDPDYDEDDIEDDKLALKEYHKFLSELYPSEYMSQKVNRGEVLSLIEKGKKYKKPSVPRKNLEKRNNSISESDESGSEEEEVSRHSSKKEKGDKNENTKFNISFTIDDKMLGGSNNGRSLEPISFEESLYDEEYYDSDICDKCGEEDDCECYDEIGEEEDTDDYDDDEEEVIIKSKNTRNTKKDKKESKGDSKSKSDSKSDSKSKNKSDKKDHPLNDFNVDTIDDESGFKKMKDLFDTLDPKEKQHPFISSIIKSVNDKERRYLKEKEKQTQKLKTTNTKKLKTMLREKDVMNDLKYFHEQMSVEEQKLALSQIEIIKQHSDISKPYRLTLIESNIPPQYKACAFRKMSSLRNMEPGGSEYYKMKNWVDAFMKIPFNQYKNLPISLNDGVEKCHEFMDNAKKILDDAVYGLNDAKLQIMQMIGTWIVNPGAIGSAIAIKGPMGTGKTTLVKEGISKILGRDFAFIALGGATDSSFLEGHSYTYEGSAWGKIVDLLLKCKSMNPVIYFDELDKISDTPKGEEIIGILTHLTDTSQNSQFHDRYFSEIDFDLSRCLFIFSYNDESKVNRILLDRMYRIQTKGYDQAQKTIISTKYLMPSVLKQVAFKEEEIIIPTDTIHHIITNHTDKEDGVRTLKRCLEIIHTKLNLYRLMKPDTNLFENDMSIKVEFPITVTPKIVDALIKKDIDNGGWKTMYM